MPAPSEGLKPCPFCGGNRIHAGFVRDGAKVSCAVCLAGVVAFNPDSYTKAADRWNTRATPSPDILRELVEALRLAADARLEPDERHPGSFSLVRLCKEWPKIRAALAKAETLL